MHATENRCLCVFQQSHRYNRCRRDKCVWPESIDTFGLYANNRRYSCGLSIQKSILIVYQLGAVHIHIYSLDICIFRLKDKIPLVEEEEKNRREETTSLLVSII